MKKFAILMVFLLIAACAPITPSRNATVNKTLTVEVNKSIEIEQQNTTEQKEPEVDLRDVPVKEAVEGELVKFPNLKAVDPDGDLIRYTFTSPLNEKGEWQTKEGDAGDRLITITASDGTNVVSQKVLLRVNPKNRPPVIEIEEPVEAKEGELITIKPNATDVDGDKVSLTYSGWMTSDTKEALYDDSGLHKVTITADDGKAKTSREIIVSVKNVNRAPKIEELAAIAVKEGQKAVIRPVAKDLDTDAIKFIYDFPFDENGAWQTELGDAGEYNVIVKASDGELEAETKVMVIVKSVNRPPVIQLESPITVQEGDEVVLNPIITDNEGDEVKTSYGGWMKSERRRTNYDDAGKHTVIITARDTAGNEARAEITIIVEELNRPPIFGAGSFN